MKAPRILKFIDMNKGDNKDTDTYNNHTLKKYSMNYAHSKHLILIYFISDLTSFVAHLTQWGKKF